MTTHNQRHHSAAVGLAATVAAVIAGPSGCYTGAHRNAEPMASGSSGAAGSDGGDEGLGDESGDAPDEGGEPPRASIGPTPLRRLTHAEYNNTLRDLLGIQTRPADAFSQDPTPRGGFSNDAELLLVGASLARGYLDVAEELSAALDLAPLVPCPPAEGDRACAASFVRDFGLRAYRRPLLETEVEGLLGVYDATAEEGFAEGVRAIVQALLTSPYFLYRVEVGDTSPNEGAVSLSSYEVASRLSYLLWRTMPDDALLAAAAADRLRDPDAVATQVQRMLGDDKALHALPAFFVEWADVGEGGLHLDAPLRASMNEELHAFASWLLWESDASYEALVTAPVGFVDSDNAGIYGHVDPGRARVRVDLDADRRAGVLTLPAVLAAHAQPDQSDPIQRGAFVRERLLCQALVDPPPGLMPSVPEVDPTLPTRERFGQHSSDPACSTCHRLIDPIGFGFEHYDELGAWRDEDSGQSIDARGEVVDAGDASGPFEGAAELGAKLAASASARRCMVTQFFRYAYGRHEVPDDRATMEHLRQRFAQSGGDLVELVVAVATSPAFARRAAVTD